jgi:RNA ligase (TIGR02306 family)
MEEKNEVLVRNNSEKQIETMIDIEPMKPCATIERILKVTKHPNADTLDVLNILGWQCVSKIGTFVDGDLAVYICIDSILPDSNPEFEFLRKDKFRVKTVKLRGQISQGICFPLSILPKKEGTMNDMTIDGMKVVEINYEEGEDVTATLGVKHYEKEIPAELRGVIKGYRPEYIYKTDEENIMGIPDILEQVRGISVYITEKVDGTSASFANKDGVISVCSRKLDIKEDENNLYWKMFKKYGIEKLLQKLGNVCLQGEIIGAGVQGNKYNLKDNKFLLFDAIDLNTGEYYDYNGLLGIIDESRELGNMLEMVPLLYSDRLLVETMEELQEFAKGSSLYNRDIPREGIVVRSMQKIQNDYGFKSRRISFKVMNPDFLLKYGE